MISSQDFLRLTIHNGLFMMYEICQNMIRSYMPSKRISFHNNFIGSLLYLKISLITMILTGCATQIPEHEVKPIQEYQHAQLKSGLTIAIHPFTDTEEVENYFGTDLLSQNI